MPETSGFHNPHVRSARGLRVKKNRAEARCFLIEGCALVEAALGAGVIPKSIFWVPGRNKQVDALAAAAQLAGAAFYAVDERTLWSLSQTQSPQGIVAQVPFIERELSALAAVVPGKGSAGILVLDDLDDPGNAGTLIRSAEALGASAVCVGPASVEPYNDKLVRATMGALFRVPIVRYPGWPELAAELARLGIRTVGAAARASDIRSVQLPERAALVLGNERQGLEALPQGAISLTVGIPQRPGADSLNVAVAGSILLYELARCGNWLSAKQ